MAKAPSKDKILEQIKNLSTDDKIEVWIELGEDLKNKLSESKKTAQTLAAAGVGKEEK